MYIDIHLPSEKHFLWRSLYWEGVEQYIGKYCFTFERDASTHVVVIRWCRRDVIYAHVCCETD